MFHTVAFNGALGATVDTDIAALTDSIMTIQNGHFVPQSDYQIGYAYASSVALLRAKLNSATLRQTSPPFIRPIDNVASPSSRTPIADYRTNMPTIKALEEMIALMTHTGAGPDQANMIVGLFQGGIAPAPQGQIITMRGTGTTTLGANAWTQAAITWADNLPAGNYAVVGLSGFSATAIAARLIFEQQNMRPGAVIGATGVIIPNAMFLKGGLGVWGYCTANRLPNVEFLAGAADVAEELYLDLVRVS